MVELFDAFTSHTFGSSGKCLRSGPTRGSPDRVGDIGHTTARDPEAGIEGRRPGGHARARRPVAGNAQATHNRSSVQSQSSNAPDDRPVGDQARHLCSERRTETMNMALLGGPGRHTRLLTSADVARPRLRRRGWLATFPLSAPARPRWRSFAARRRGYARPNDRRQPGGDPMTEPGTDTPTGTDPDAKYDHPGYEDNRSAKRWTPIRNWPRGSRRRPTTTPPRQRASTRSRPAPRPSNVSAATRAELPMSGKPVSCSMSTAR